MLIGPFEYLPSEHGCGLWVKQLAFIGLVVSYAVVDNYGNLVECEVPVHTVAE